MSRLERKFNYCGQPAKFACDQQCDKAWGINNRPRVFEDDPKKRAYGINATDSHSDSNWPTAKEQGEFDTEKGYEYFADQELGDAPENPGTWEGSDAKPTCEEEKMNKWCVRECERCTISNPGESHLELELQDFNKRY